MRISILCLACALFGVARGAPPSEASGALCHFVSARQPGAPLREGRPFGMDETRMVKALRAALERRAGVVMAYNGMYLDDVMLDPVLEFVALEPFDAEAVERACDVFETIGMYAVSYEDIASPPPPPGMH